MYIQLVFVWSISFCRIAHQLVFSSNSTRCKENRVILPSLPTILPYTSDQTAPQTQSTAYILKFCHVCVCLGLTCSLTRKDDEGETADSRFLCADGDNRLPKNNDTVQHQTWHRHSYYNNHGARKLNIFNTSHFSHVRYIFLTLIHFIVLIISHKEYSSYCNFSPASFIPFKFLTCKLLFPPH